MKWKLPWLRDRSARMGVAYLVLVLALVPSGVSFYLVDGFVRSQDEVRFNLATGTVQGLVEKRLAYYQDSLISLRGLHDASGGLQRQNWQNYFSSFDFKARYPGLAAIGFLERVVPQNREEHQARVVKEGVANYQLGGSSTNDAFPIVYIEPNDKARRAILGTDMAGDRTCLEAMARACDFGGAAGTGPITFPMPTGERSGRDMLLLVPTYLGLHKETTPEKRRAALTGYVFVAFRIDEMVRMALGKDAPAGVRVEIFDGEANPQNLVYASAVAGTDSPARQGNTGRINFAGHHWSLRFSSLPAFEDQSLAYLPPLVLFCGLGFSFALFGIAWVQARARLAAEGFSQELRHAQMRYQLIERATNDAIWDWDISTGKVVWNEAIQAMFIYAEDKIQPTLEWWKQKVHPEDLARIENGRESALQTGGEFWADEYRFRRGDNTYADVIDRGYIVRNRQGVPVQMIGSMVDITGRKLAEEARRRSEQRLSLHVQQTPLAVIEWDLDFKVTEWNPAAERVFGYSAAEAVGKHGLQLIVPPSAQHQVEKVWQELLRQTTRIREDGTPALGGRGSVNENTTKDGRTIICDWYNTPLVSNNGHVIGVASLALDVTARKRAEQGLAAEKQRLAVTLRSIGDGVITTDTHGCITMINKVAEILTGWGHNEAIGKPLGIVFHLVHQKTLETMEFPIERLLKTGHGVGVSHNWALLAQNGTRRNIDSSGAPIRDEDSRIIGAVLVFRDVTEQQAMADELLRADKLESLGILAGGIAHDFNNILTAITGNLSLVKMHTNKSERIHARLEEAEKATMRARDLTQQLLTFAKGGAPVRKTASINEIVKDSTEFAMRGANVRCEFSLSEDLFPVDVDEGQISQVINNLAINAIQAMPEGGVIHVLTENVNLDAEDGVPLLPGRYVKISIQDHGTGIRPEHLTSIFDPYFTTKQKGSGLGLATSYSIIKKHEGLIKVESKLGVGTVFHILLPASEKSVAPVIKTENEPLSGHGRILVMDDEPLILELAVTALGELGYDVETVTDGAAAIQLYGDRKGEGRPFAAVIMDLTIPGGMGGKEAIKRMISLHPDVKAIVCSGYSNDPVMANYAEYGFKGFVCKPYRVEDLALAVKAMLNGH